MAGNLGALQLANTGTGTIFTSGLAAGAAAAVSGSGKTIVLPTGGMSFVPLVCNHAERHVRLEWRDKYFLMDALCSARHPAPPTRRGRR